jgi:hypothetical protein
MESLPTIVFAPSIAMESLPTIVLPLSIAMDGFPTIVLPLSIAMDGFPTIILPFHPFLRGRGRGEWFIGYVIIRTKDEAIQEECYGVWIASPFGL